MDGVKRIFLFTIVAVLLPTLLFADVSFCNSKPLTATVSSDESVVVRTAFSMFQSDYTAVFDQPVLSSRNGVVWIATLGNNKAVEKKFGSRLVSEVKKHAEAFLLKVMDDKIYILGSDNRGTAYGILELSRMIGVSPWSWWADSPIRSRSVQVIKNGFSKISYPSVKLRGIFINDEDWGLTPWSSTTYEPLGRQGSIGPQTHARIFELLLRLRANMFWPAMHACSVPFYQIPGNQEMADRYGIMIGTSHCEPMMCNANGEWKENGVGDYNYVTNRDNLLKFWESRVRQLAHSDNVYTLGLRGIHDGPMLGAKSVAEQKSALSRVIADQRSLLSRYVNPDITRIPQVFIPYKEVLDVYHAGLQVPDDVTLMWCDDNYGYIQHFPTPSEQARKGGNGIYYHVSYWGRPHDYLWLATTHPALVYTQLKRAYDHGIRSMWILNVGDIKPAEYLTELFMDMAWDIHAIDGSERGLQRHLSMWLTREFGETLAAQLLPVMTEYARLAYIRKPEFMANTRVEEKDSVYKIVKDMPWSLQTVEKRITDYQSLENKVTALSPAIPSAIRSSWFQLIEYPVRAAAQMNLKLMYGQLARHGLASWGRSDAAYDTIVSLTQRYNSISNGKWKNMMTYAPRNLRDFGRLPHLASSSPMPDNRSPLRLFNGRDYVSFSGIQPVCYGLGYQGGAISLSKGSCVVYTFTPSPSLHTDSLMIEVALAPNYPDSGNQIRYSVSVDDDIPQVVDFHTEGRSEEWKMNVLRNQAIRRTVHHVLSGRPCSIKITALDDGIVLDQLSVLCCPSSVQCIDR